MQPTDQFKFDPTQFGYRPLADFPEIQRCYQYTEHFSPKAQLFLKVTAMHLDGEKRVVLWYSLCLLNVFGATASDDRLRFYSGSFDTHASRAEDNGTPGHTLYTGTVSTESFARELIQHLIGTCRNEDVATHGLERLNRDTNAEARAALDKAAQS